MKKLLVLILAALIMALTAIPAFAGTPYYFFAEVEDMTLTGDMAVIDWQGASGGKAVVSATAGYTDNNFSVNVDIPADGTYAVWVRAWVKSNHQCTFQFANSFGSIAKGSIFKMLGSSSGAAYIWLPLDSRAGVNDDPDVTKTVALTAGTVTFSLGVRSIANVVDTNRNDAKTTHYLDCVMITDDTDFDPNTDDWAEIRDGLLTPVNYEYYLVTAPTVAASGLCNKRAYKMDKDKKVITNEKVNEQDSEVSFEKWYLRTMVQSRAGENGKLDVRFVSMLDENIDSYKEAGFIIDDGTTPVTVKTTEAIESFIADGKEVSIGNYSEENDYFFLAKNMFSSEVVAADPSITVTPYVALAEDGQIISGSPVTFKLSELTK